MNEAWTKWYGTVLSKNDPLFWAHKLHFSIAGDHSFYNFPYSFGYLFSLSIYARRKELGASFMKTYVDVLRDTGRMTAEDLIQKHFGEDIQKPEFWQKSIDVVLKKLNTIEGLI
jgi:oligoendopeptidase F